MKFLLQAQKIEEHKRKKERKEIDKQVREHLERLKRIREASAKAHEANARSAPEAANTEGFPGGLGNDMGQFLSDPDILAAFKASFFFRKESEYLKWITWIGWKFKFWT